MKTRATVAKAVSATLLAIALVGCGGEKTTTTTTSTTTTTIKVTTTLTEVKGLLPHVHDGTASSDPRAAGLVKDEVIVDQAGWARSWAALHAGQSNKPALPPHDFKNEHLLVIQRGYNTGGYSIGEVKGLVDSANITVTATITEPGDGCVTTQAFTFPWVVVSVPADVTGASVIDNATKKPC